MRLPVSTMTALMMLATGALACTSGADSTDSSEAETRVRPGGTDRPGTLTVVVPAGATAVEPTEVVAGALRGKLAEALGPLRVGTQAFALNTKGPTYFVRVGGQATIAFDSPTVITTALLGVNSVAGPATLGLGGFQSPNGITIATNAGRAGSVSASADGSQLLPLLEGDYEVSFGLGGLDGAHVKAAAGNTSVVRLTDPAGRRVTRLRAPTRELPDSDECSASPWLISSKNVGLRQEVTLEDGQELDVGISAINEGKQYQLVLPALRDPIDVPLGDRGTVRNWQIGRIDVDDVTINGGSTVAGTYDVFAANEAGARIGASLLRCAPRTNSGIDVPHGHYRVEVKYQTTEAGQKTDVHIIDVP